jgi:hypothetical protein
MFGKIENQSTLTPDNAAYAPGNQTVTTRMNGVTFSLGAIYEDFSGLSEALKPLSLGLTLTTRGKLSTLEQSLYTWVDQADTSSDREGYVVIPATFGVGLSWKAGERWLLEADYRAQPWTTSEIDGRSPLGIQDMHLVGFGVEFHPLRSSATESFLNKLTYRFGAYYHQSYVRLNDQSVNAWAVTVGMGIPLTAESRLDMHAEYGIRGTTLNGLTKDNIFRFSLALNFSEAWFTRPEED